MKGKERTVNNFFVSNKLRLHNSCNAIGALISGGLSNYWGLQMDNYFYKDQKHLKESNFLNIKREFILFLKKYKLLGNFYLKRKKIYEKSYDIPIFLRKLLKAKDKQFK